MQQKEKVAEVQIDIHASPEEVWDALVNPEIIKEYMFGAQAISDWQEGSSLHWKGEWQGHQYEEKGEILRLIPEKSLQYTRYNPLSGLPDIPASYNTITIELTDAGEQKISLTLTEDNNPTEKAKDRAEEVWRSILEKLKNILES